MAHASSRLYWSDIFAQVDHVGLPVIAPCIAMHRHFGHLLGGIKRPGGAGAAFRAALDLAVMMERRVSAFVHGEKDFQLKHQWVPWSQISPWAGIAMIAGEDQKFPFHHGFDFDSIQNAIDAADDGQRLRGASTISSKPRKTCSCGTDAVLSAKVSRRISPYC